VTTTRAHALVPPHDAALERAILGAPLLEPETLDALLVVPTEHFFDERHRLIHGAMRALYAAGQPIDLVMLNRQLAASDRLAEAGGPAYLAQLFEEGLIPAHVAGYIEQLVDLWRKRRLLQLGLTLTQEAQNGQRGRDVLAMAAAAVAELTSAEPARTLTDYIETAKAFITEDDPPLRFIVPQLLPVGVIMLIHGEPRARKSLVAFEFALAAATGTAAFGLPRLTPAEPVTVLYVQEEDPRTMTRPRLRALINARCARCPDTLYVAGRRGVDLDDPVWVDRLITDLKRLGAKLLVLDAARRLSAKTDEGPSKVRELTMVLRTIVTGADVSVIIVHHDVKPPTNGQDSRRRSQRASGGDWFAACECPVHVERIGARESLVFPEDFKFGADPAPFTFTFETADGLITRLVGVDTTSEGAERAGIRGKVFDWLKVNGPATKTAMRKAGLGQWDAIETALDLLTKEGKVDAGPGRKAGSLRFFVAGQPPTASGDDSAGANDVPF